MNDPVFKSIREIEVKILTNFYLSKKKDFKNNLTSYLNNQNLSFVTMLTKQIIYNEGGRKNFEQKLKDEIQEIYNNEELSKIDYYIIMLIGKCGV